MGASYNKSVLKSRTVRGAKAAAEAEWTLGWATPANREEDMTGSAGTPSPARSGAASSRSDTARPEATERSSNDANAKNRA